VTVESKRIEGHVGGVQITRLVYHPKARDTPTRGKSEGLVHDWAVVRNGTIVALDLTGANERNEFDKGRKAHWFKGRSRVLS